MVGSRLWNFVSSRHMAVFRTCFEKFAGRSLICHFLVHVKVLAFLTSRQ
jgi:hypothetical protein